MFARSTGNPFQFVRFALRARVPFAIATMVFGMVGLGFSYLGTGGAATHPLTALCLIGLGGCILRTKRYGPSSYIRQGVLGAVLLACAARGMDVVLSSTTGSTTGAVFGPLAGFSGSFSIETAITLGAFAAAALLRQSSGRLGSIFLVAGAACVYSTLLSVIFGITFFKGQVSAFTLVSMGCATFGMVSVYIHRPFVRVAFLLGDVGSQTRVMATAVLVFPMIAGVILDRFGGSGGLGPLEVAVVSMISLSMLVFLLSTSARHEGSVAARRRAERENAMQSRLDTLTGALNRFGITEVVEGAWVEFKSAGSKFGMILIDLDYFRRLDATYGLDDGEAVLTRVVETLQPQLRGTDSLGRWGADEFLVLLKIKDAANIAIVADRLRNALADVSNPFCAGLVMEPAAIDVPFGVSTLDEGDDAPTEAITRADASLHLAKTAAAMTKDAQMTKVGITGPELDVLAELPDQIVTKVAAA